MIWIVLIILAVLAICALLFLLLKSKNPDDSINEAKKMYFPAQKKSSKNPE